VLVAPEQDAVRIWKRLQKMQLNSADAWIIENSICFEQVFAISIKAVRPAYVIFQLVESQGGHLATLN